MKSQHLKRPKRKLSSQHWHPTLLKTVCIALPVLCLIIFIWQLLRINNLNHQVADLKKSQIPSRAFKSYEDCVLSGGKSLYTMNGQFSACLGGKFESSGDSYQAFLQYSAQNLPRINERKTNKGGENSVEAADASADLVAFLKQSNEGCEAGTKLSFKPAFYKVRKEVSNRFALVNFGCAKDKFFDSTYSIAIKLSDGWSMLSSTNNMNEAGVPSCLLVDMFKISKELSPKCFENTGYNNGKLKDVTYL